MKFNYIELFGSLIALILTFWSSEIKAQKMKVNEETIKNWCELGDYGISNDGNFVWFNVIEAGGSKNYIQISSTDSKYITRHINLVHPTFSENSAHFIAQGGDSLIILDLATKKTRILKNISQFKCFASGRNNLLLYMQLDTFYIENLDTKVRWSLGTAEDFTINPQNTDLILWTRDNVRWVDISTRKSMRIFNGRIDKPIFNGSGDAVCFISGEQSNYSLWYYHKDRRSAKQLLNKEAKELNGYCLSNGNTGFACRGKYVFFNSKKAEAKLKPDADIITKTLEIWHYRDLSIYPAQLYNLARTNDREYKWMVNVEDGAILQIENEELELYGEIGENNTILLRSRLENVRQSRIVDQLKFRRNFLVTLDRLDTIFLNNNIDIHVWVADSKVLIWKDSTATDFFSFDVHKKKVINLSRLVKPVITSNLIDDITVVDSSTAIFSDGYDLWQLDLKGNKRALNLTKGFGFQHKMKFRLVPMGIGSGNCQVIVTAENNKMQVGLWTIELNKETDPKMYVMDDFLYYANINNAPKPPIKAKSGNAYLLTRQRASSSPNLLFTTNFKTFKVLSNIHPEFSWNWLTSELVTWQKPDGLEGKGILYKPENFDPAKKYPVIFSCYQERASELNLFKKPALSTGPINIPYYVSSGYIVFALDIINNRPGEIGRTVINTVVSAAEFLTRTFSWIDKRKMGVQGHSFGGFEVNLLISGTKIFAAANACAGMSDVLSAFGDNHFGQNANSDWVENGQPQLKATPWQSPNVYVDNTPIFRANQIVTPLLLQNNYGDESLFFQGIEMYNALRRLRKPVWLLNYKGGGHILSGKNSLDFTIRQKQFFDHYLKDSPAPLWMVEGISAKFRETKSGLKLDSLNRRP